MYYIQVSLGTDTFYPLNITAILNQTDFHDFSINYLTNAFYDIDSLNDISHAEMKISHYYSTILTVRLTISLRFKSLS